MSTSSIAFCDNIEKTFSYLSHKNRGGIKELCNDRVLFSNMDCLLRMFAVYSRDPAE